MYDFSIITVCYNSDNTIKNTFESIKGQVGDLKIQSIIIDGKSTDNTLSIINDYQRTKSDNIDVIVICEDDSGIYDAMNKGLRLASGNIISLLNSDDFFYKNDVLLKVLDKFKSKAIDILHADVIWKYSFSNHSDIFMPRFGNQDLNKLKSGMSINHPTLFCLNKIYRENELFDIKYKYVADWIWMLNVINLKRYNIYYFSYPLVCFGMDGVSNRFIYKRYMEILSVFNSLMKKREINKIEYLKSVLNLFFDAFKTALYNLLTTKKVRELIRLKRKG